jgi:hypothetical protein
MKRTVEIAREVVRPTCGTVMSNYCVFRAGEDCFGVPLERVEEIIHKPIIDELPASPPFLLGMITSAGAPVPVIDLAMTTVLPDPLYCIVIRVQSEAGPTRVAMAADELLYPSNRGLSAAVQFDPVPVDSTFIEGRLTCAGVIAWALDPEGLMHALQSPALD